MVAKRDDGLPRRPGGYTAPPVKPPLPTCVQRPVVTGAWAWCVLAALLAAGAGLVSGVAATAAWDWQPGRAASEPWRAWTAAFVHWSPRQLSANLLGTAVVAAFGAVAAVRPAQVVAWLVAWPLTQLGLLLRPELAHFGGLSGVLHAGVAVVAVHLLGQDGTRRHIGWAVLGGLALKVVLEAPWGPVLRHPPDWDIAVAPLSHASGALVGLLFGLLAARRARRHDGRRGSPDQTA
jgi:rhomboid family GlyGly-CTERM serine protease